MIKLWFLLALSAAALTALTHIFDKILTTELHPWTIPAIKKIINGIILILVSHFLFQFYFPMKPYFWFFLLILALPEAAATVFYFAGIKGEEISRIIPYQSSLLVVFPFVFALLFLSESVTSINVLGVLLISIGAYVILSDGEFKIPRTTKGLILITLAAFAWAVYGILAKMGTSFFPPYILAIYVFFIGDAFIWGVNLKYKKKEQIISVKKTFNTKTFFILLIACLGASLSSLFTFFALGMAPASKVLPLVKTSPLFLVLMSGTILKERKIFIRLLGSLLLVIGIFILYI